MFYLAYLWIMYPTFVLQTCSLEQVIPYCRYRVKKVYFQIIQVTYRNPNCIQIRFQKQRDYSFSRNISLFKVYFERFGREGNQFS